MRHAANGRSRLFVLTACTVLGFAPDGRGADEPDRYEEQVAVRCAERALKAAKGERAQWIKALEAAFPDKVVHANTDEEYATWFTLLAGKHEDWRRDEGAPALTELFDKVVQRLELGPVPSIQRDEFARYAKKLRRDNPAPERADPNEDADKVFRVLDRNADGELEPEEYTVALKDNKDRADADGNGRVTKEEYREHFQRRVVVKTDALIVAAKSDGDPLVRGTEGKAVAGLPAWFPMLDTDQDGQVALFEWRKAGRPLITFAEMDLNADGLLTRDEYLRFVKMSDDKRKQEKREENAP